MQRAVCAIVLAELDLYLRNVPALATGRCRRFIPAAARRRSCRPTSRHCWRASPRGCARGRGLRDPEVDSAETDARIRRDARLGISRISLGVQDFDSEVLRLVNRPQPFEITAALCAEARLPA
jgi:hypothetical protein